MPRRTARKKLVGRERRLEKAPGRVAAERGKPANILRRYRRYFGVDWECAISEIQALGYEFDPVYLSNLRTSLSRNARKGRKHTPIARWEFDLHHGIEPVSDDTYAYIAGYTSGGAAFGTTWEELEEMEELNIFEPDDPADAPPDQEPDLF